MASGKTELVGKLTEYVDDAQGAVQTMHTEWDSYRKFYLGDHTEDLGLTEEDVLNWVPVNLVFAHTETRVPILLDSAPLPYVVSPDGSRNQDARTIEEALQAHWRERRVVKQYKQAVRDQIVLGTGVLKVWWNPTIGPIIYSGDDGARVRGGDVDVSWQDPYAVYPDPVARNVEECEYIAMSHDVSEERGRRLWDKFNPKTCEKLTPNGTERSDSLWDRAWQWLLRPTPDEKLRRNMYRVWEVYHEAGERLTVYSGQEVLFDGPNPTPMSRYPFVFFPSYEHGYGFWGVSEIAQIKRLQQAIDMQYMRLYQHVQLLGNTGFIGDDPDFQPTNKPGAYMYYRQSHTVRERALAPLPNWTFQATDHMLQMFDTVTGVHDVTRGIKPGSIQSGIGIQQLQETAMTRLRDQSRDNTVGLQNVAQIMLEYMQQGYSEERTMGYMKGSRPRQVTVGPQQFWDEMGGVEDQGELETLGMGDETGVRVPVEYRVVVESDGELPLNAMARMEKAIRLAQVQCEDGLPAIDREALLDDTNFSRRKEVLERIQVRQQQALQGQAMAMLQQEQAAAQMGAPMGAPGMAPAGGEVPQGPAPGPMPEVPVEALPSPGMGVDGGMPYSGPETAAGGVNPDVQAGSDDPNAVLDQLQMYFGPDDMEMLVSVIETLAAGGELTPEQQAWLGSLDEEQMMALTQALSALGIEPPAI